MQLRSSDLLPCSAFFSAGRLFSGILALLMQMSLIFWPSAASWARRSQGRSQVETMLQQLARQHRVKPDPYAQPAKKFRRAA